MLKEQVRGILLVVGVCLVIRRWMVDKESCCYQTLGVLVHRWVFNGEVAGYWMTSLDDMCISYVPLSSYQLPSTACNGIYTELQCG